MPALNLSELTLIQRLEAVKPPRFSPSSKKNLILLFFCIQFHAYNHFRVFNNSPMPVNMLLLACEIITLKRNLNYTADGAVWKWFSEYIVLICECRHRLAVYASFTVTESHLKRRRRQVWKKLDIDALQFHIPSFCAVIVQQNCNICYELVRSLFASIRDLHFLALRKEKHLL